MIVQVAIEVAVVIAHVAVMRTRVTLTIGKVALVTKETAEKFPETLILESYGCFYARALKGRHGLRFDPAVKTVSR